MGGNRRMNKKVETVLAVKRKEIPESILNMDGFKTFEDISTEDVNRVLRNALFINRDKAEQDENYKQIIPYTFFICSPYVFLYKRNKRSSEHRLHDSYSLGVGGHVNQDDWNEIRKYNVFMNDEAEMFSVISKAAQREIDEEVDLSYHTEQKHLRWYGIVNHDRNSVGKVHLGIVLYMELMRPVLRLKEDGICYPIWLESNTLQESNYFPLLEEWSRIIASHLSGRIFNNE